jgi:hypothetical protein
MFKISSKPTFTHDVEIQVPVDGGHSTERLKTRYRVVEFSKLETLDLGNVKDQDKYLDLIVDGFEELVDDDEKPVKNPAAHTKKLLGLLFVRGPVMRQYMEAMAGAKVKN